MVHPKDAAEVVSEIRAVEEVVVVPCAGQWETVMKAMVRCRRAC